MSPRDPFVPLDPRGTRYGHDNLGLDRSAEPRPASIGRILTVLLIAGALGVIGSLLMGAQAGAVVAAAGVLIVLGMLGGARPHP
jgi:hypothetical protein